VNEGQIDGVSNEIVLFAPMELVHTFPDELSKQGEMLYWYQDEGVKGSVRGELLEQFDDGFGGNGFSVIAVRQNSSMGTAPAEAAYTTLSKD
jgi:hypothetical protein